MKKKVIGLSTLLLVLLLGSFTTSCAYEYTITNDNIDALFNYYNSNWYNNNLNGYKNGTKNGLAEYQDDYDNCLIQIYNVTSGGKHVLYLYFFNSQGTTINYWNSGTSYSLSGNFDRYNPTSGSMTRGITTLSATSNDRVIYTMYRNDFANREGPWENIQIMGPFSEPHQEISFDMASYGSTQYIDLTFLGDDGLTYNYEDIPIYYKPNDTSETYIGILNNPELTTLTNDNYAIIYYKNGSWYAKGIQQRDLNTYVYSSPYLNIIQNNDLLVYNYGQKSRFSVRDCFYFYSIDNNIGERAIALWYIGSDHTFISGDKIDPATFDNYDDYNNNVNNMLDNIDDIDNIVAGTEPIVETLTDDQQVSGELAGLVSGDADDIANRFGYSPIENPFVAVVVDITESLTDILLGSGDVSLNFGFGGRDYFVSSSKFVLPDNTLTSFIHLCCNAFVLWNLWKYGFKLYEWVNSGRLQNLVNETNGHQYFLF